jgi:hypothetical protein
VLGLGAERPVGVGARAWTMGLERRERPPPVSRRSARAASLASGVVPTDLQKRITLMRGTYATAQAADFAPALAKRKLTTAMFAARVKQVAELDRLGDKFTAAENVAKAATDTRDKAGEARRTRVAKFRNQAKSDLRKHPELKAKLAL